MKKTSRSISIDQLRKELDLGEKSGVYKNFDQKEHLKSLKKKYKKIKK